jgi:hypothetical protein
MTYSRKSPGKCLNRVSNSWKPLVKKNDTEEEIQTEVLRNKSLVLYLYTNVFCEM